MVPEWFWTLDYLLAPFFTAIIGSVIAIVFAGWLERKGAEREERMLHIWERIATALERGE